MLELARITATHAGQGALNEQVPLWGFLDDYTFVTKPGDVGVVLRVEGIDYECLDGAEIDYFTERFERAVKLFDPKYRIYQYLFRRNGVPVPHQSYSNPVVAAASRARMDYFARKGGDLYSVDTYFVVLFEGFRYDASMLAALRKFEHGLAAGLGAIRSQLSSQRQSVLIASELEAAQRQLMQKVHGFIANLQDVVNVELAEKAEAFRVLSRLVNVDPAKADNARLKYDTHIDYFLAASYLEGHRRHLRIDDHYVRLLTLKDPTATTMPLILGELYEIGASYHVVTEWQPMSPEAARARITSIRRHMHNTKLSLVSQANNEADVLVDDSKAAMVAQLGECLQDIEIRGHQFGRFSLTIVVYDKDLAVVDRACARLMKVFSMHDGALIEERLGQLNAFFSTLPGNSHFNVRHLYIENTNYADYSFLFSVAAGEPWNTHLDREYLAVLESEQGTPYYLNLHDMDVAHTCVLGRTGTGKSYLLGFLALSLQKYEPLTFIFDLGGSFGAITKLFGGSHMRPGATREAMGALRINPFCLESTPENLGFLASFVRVLLESGGPALTAQQSQAVYKKVKEAYLLSPNVRCLRSLARVLPPELTSRMARWVGDGQYGFAFDNVEDNVSVADWQYFDFEGMDRVPELVEPLLFYVLHRASARIYDPKQARRFKAFIIDEAWRFFRSEVIRDYITEALKTWRKKNAAVILATHTVEDMEGQQILRPIVDSCTTKIFLANPALDEEAYRTIFKLKAREVGLIRSLIAKRQLVVKKGAVTKKLNLNLGGTKSPLHWLCVNDPNSNARRDAAFETHGFERGLQALTEGVA